MAAAGNVHQPADQSGSNQPPMAQPAWHLEPVQDAWGYRCAGGTRAIPGMQAGAWWAALYRWPATYPRSTPRASSEQAH